MEAKELRIGNWVNFKFSNLSSNVMICYNDLRNFERNIQIGQFNNIYTPIPLTEEWKDKIEYNEYIRIDMIGFIIYSNGHQYHFSVNDYPYVHQIQNLYLALTNEELTIKQ